MKKIAFLVVISFCSLNSCKSNNSSNDSIVKPIVYDSTFYGTYHKIGKYDIYAPFKGEPKISITLDNDMLFGFEHRYADINENTNEFYIYAVSIYRLKKEPKWSDSMQKEDFVAHLISNGLENSEYHGRLISYDTVFFNNKYTIKQKMHIVMTHEDEQQEFFIFDCNFIMDNLIIRPYVMTPPNDKGKEVAEGFFKSLKMK